MATPAATATEYCSLLVKSRLLPTDEVESLYKKWKEERPGSDERVDSFRRFLVNRRALTEYQAALVQRGRADGFFLGGYKILDQVGKGQMGGVYKAVHNFGQIVALKILPASRAKNAQVLGRFQREARLLTQLDHPNVVRAYQVGESGGINYIVMEYLEGETLGEVLERRTRLPVGEAVRLMRQALDGLQHLHDRRMVHRDMKPANLMLTPGYDKEKSKPDATWDATVKILDIGLGREMFDEEAKQDDTVTQLTQEGSVLGTPDYLSPEQAKDARSADIRADIYSIGCVLYHCLVGRPPFPETNIMAQMLRHATEAAAPLAQFVDDLPAGFQTAMNGFLAKAPDARYQTPAEASAALAPFATGGTPAVAAKVIPAYKDWLESESAMEIPKNLPGPGAPAKAPSAPQPVPQPTKPAPAKPVPAAAAATVKSAPVKPGTATAPALKPGTGTAPALKTGSAAVPQPTKPAPAAPKPAPEPPKPVVVQPAPMPVPVPVPVVEEVDVELVTEPVEVRAKAPAPAPHPSGPRPMFPLDRRDWILLTIGAASVLSAAGFGFGLAKLLKRKSDTEEREG